MTDTNRQILDEIRFAYLHSYRVAGMSEPWSMKMERTLTLLKDQGIGAILTLTEDNLYGTDYRAAGFLHHHEPIEDCEPPSTDGMDRALAFINDCLEEGHGVAVHCLEGRGRTGTVLGAWLGLRETLSPQDAIRRVYDLRERTIITPSQRAFLHRYLNGTGREVFP
jgi:atypical dual specificity phosphatase